MKKAVFVTSLSLLALVGCTDADIEERTTAVPPSSPTATSEPSAEAPSMAESESAAPMAGSESAGAADQELMQRVEQALSTDPALSAAAENIQITATNGEVTLMGSVSSEQEKTNLGNKAQQVAGVTKVNNQLEVGVASR
ncbi:MAG: BON domain-containing protein [Candidatus Binatia bacterium]